MKKILLFLFLLISIYATPQFYWEEINTEFNYISDINVERSGALFLAAYSLYYNDGDYSNWIYQDMFEGSSYSCSKIKNLRGRTYFITSTNLIVLEFGESQYQILSELNSCYDILPINDTLIFSGLFEAIERSTDGGYTFERVFTLPYNEGVETLAIHPNGDIYAGTATYTDDPRCGVYKSTDGGDTWNHVGLDWSFVEDIEIDSQGNIYAGTSGNWFTGMGGLYRSTDQGNTWDTIRELVYVNSIAITPGDSVFAACYNWQSGIPGIYATLDGGNSWGFINEGLEYPYAKLVKVGGDGYLYCVTDGNQDRLFRSSIKVTGLENKLESNQQHFSVYPNPTQDIITVNTNSGIMGSSIKLYDIAGNIIYQGKLSNNQQEINIENYPTGIYLLQIHSNTISETHKIIKN